MFIQKGLSTLLKHTQTETHTFCWSYILLVYFPLLLFSEIFYNRCIRRRYYGNSFVLLSDDTWRKRFLNSFFLVWLSYQKINKLLNFKLKTYVHSYVDSKFPQFCTKTDNSPLTYRRRSRNSVFKRLRR